MSAAGSGESAVVLDQSAALARLDGDGELYAEIVGIYLEDSPRQVAEIKEALNLNDADRAGKAAHSLKSASGNIGGEAVRQVAFLIEQHGKKGALELQQSLLPELETQFAKLVDALRQLVKR